MSLLALTTVSTSSPAFIIGRLVGAVVAGVLCGLLPLLVGLSKQRAQLALSGFGLCIVAGVFGGLILAVPVALIDTGFIVVLAKAGAGARAPDPYQDWSRHSWQPGPAAAAPVPQPFVPVGPPLRPGEIAICCPSCSQVSAAKVNSLPPWCPRCGADLKAACQEPAAAAPGADKMPG